MKNFNIIHPGYDNVTTPELWYMHARSGTIFITFTEACWNLLQTIKVREQHEYVRPSLEHAWGEGLVFPPVQKRKSGRYTMYIPIGDQLDNEKRSAIAHTLGGITNLLDLSISCEAGEHREPRSGEQVQLFSMETFYSKDGGYHAAPMDVSISPPAAQFLIAHSKQAIPGVHRAMKDHQVAMYPEDKKKKGYYFGTDLTGVIREKGTLSFVTAGNCACLGQMPEDVRDNEGLYLDSHNLDTSWQQLSMIIGVATTWRWVRRSLGYK